MILAKIFKKPIHTKVFEEEINDSFNDKHKIIKVVANKPVEIIAKKAIEETNIPQKVYPKTKNKFLNPADGFGKMVKGKSF